jgi:hypothetical protein
MRLLLLAICGLAIFGAGHYFGRQSTREQAVWAVTVANAKADTYGLAAIETAKQCRATNTWFKK